MGADASCPRLNFVVFKNGFFTDLSGKESSLRLSSKSMRDHLQWAPNLLDPHFKGISALCAERCQGVPHCKCCPLDFSGNRILVKTSKIPTQINGDPENGRRRLALR